MTKETSAEQKSLLANDIRVLVNQLNEKLAEAAICGLKVEVDNVIMHRFGLSASISIFNVKVWDEVK